MPDPDLSTITPAMVGTVYLDQLPQATAAAIRAACAAEHRAWLREHEQALEARQAALEDAHEARRVWLLGSLARERAQIERDADARIELEVEREAQERAAEWQDRLDTRTAQRDEARMARDEVTELLLGLVRQVFGPKKVYPFSRGVTEVDQYRLNVALRPHGIRLRSQRGDSSDRQVTTRLEPARVAQRVVFWIDRTVPEGVVDEDAEPAEDHGPLALPEGPIEAR